VTVTAVVFLLHAFAAGVNLAVVPAMAAAAGAGAVNAVFFTAYAEAIETILQCFCEDLERNDGSAVRRYFMPDSLKVLILAKEIGPRGRRQDAEATDESFAAEVKEARRERREERRRRKGREALEGTWDDVVGGGQRGWLWLPNIRLTFPSNPFRRR